MLLTALTITGWATGCAEGTPVLQQTAYAQGNGDLAQEVTAAGKASDAAITLGSGIMKLEDGFSAVSYDGDTGLMTFSLREEPQVMQESLISLPHI